MCPTECKRPVLIVPVALGLYIWISYILQIKLHTIPHASIPHARCLGGSVLGSDLSPRLADDPLCAVSSPGREKGKPLVSFHSVIISLIPLSPPQIPTSKHLPLELGLQPLSFVLAGGGMQASVHNRMQCFYILLHTP